jgi:hypothetical protein
VLRCGEIKAGGQSSSIVHVPVDWTERYRSSRNKIEYNVVYNIQNDAIPCAKQLKTCITILRTFPFLEGRILGVFGAFIHAPIPHNENEEVIWCLG